MDQEQKSEFGRDFKLDQKTIVRGLGLIAFLGSGWVLYQFSAQFDQRFDKKIEPTHTEIDTLRDNTKREFEYRDKEFQRLEKAYWELEKRVRDVEQIKGGKK